MLLTLWFLLVPIHPPVIEDNYVRNVELVDVIDGDTLDLDIDLGWGIHLKQRVRLVGLDAPEVRGDERKAGLYVEDVVEKLVTRPGVRLTLKSDRYSRDMYGRTLGVVYVDGISINKLLVDQKYAWETDKDGAVIGERSLDRLTGIPPLYKYSSGAKKMAPKK